MSITLGTVKFLAIFNASFEAVGAELPDLSSITAGASVLPAFTSPTYSPRARWDVALWTRLLSKARSPATALSPGIEPGDCWPFAGSYGTLGIQMPSTIHVSGITVAHTEVSSLPSTAPRNFVLWGLEQAENPAVVRLLEGQYNVTGSHTQFFGVDGDVGRCAVKIDQVVLEIESNWGFKELTCLYHVRVHGQAV
ncbi:hypothetical protein BV25DRAFT_1807478 [Artomyces pyxidatus]|uniref:Uncharacterized protein n=1 Tax=Artomyces pyxidatus TaxID=48021 RepID=A0ACB8SVE6_9AGAM|nr:hypothetical protein BV25DRAFT_1807478 [Artomyces pyxidatus]